MFVPPNSSSASPYRTLLSFKYLQIPTHCAFGAFALFRDFQLQSHKHNNTTLLPAVHCIWPWLTQQHPTLRNTKKWKMYFFHHLLSRNYFQLFYKKNLSLMTSIAGVTTPVLPFSPIHEFHSRIVHFWGNNSAHTQIGHTLCFSSSTVRAFALLFPFAPWHLKDPMTPADRQPDPYIALFISFQVSVRLQLWTGWTLPFLIISQSHCACAYELRDSLTSTTQKGSPGVTSHDFPQIMLDYPYSADIEPTYPKAE